MDTCPQLLTIPMSVVDDLFEEQHDEIIETPTSLSGVPIQSIQYHKLDPYTEYSHTLFLLQQGMIDEQGCIDRMIDIDHSIYPIYKSRPYDHYNYYKYI